MSTEILIDRALYLPAPDLEALVHGRIVAAIPKVAIERGWSFILCPGDTSINSFSVEIQYHPNFSAIAQSAIAQLQTTTIEIKAWAECEFCTLVFELEKLEILSQLVGWTPVALTKTLEQRHHLFLSCLRVYKLPETIKVSTDCLNLEKLGKFISLASLGLSHSIPVPLTVNTSLPILSDLVFNQRKRQLAERELPPYPELEQLHSVFSQLAASDSSAKELEHDIEVFLGWADSPMVNRSNPDLSWIKTIADVGNSSDGEQFERLVRRSFIELGFKNSNSNPYASLDPSSCGGAGGLDFYCQEPYQVVGECKATKTERVPDSTPAQLVRLGLKHLQEEYDNCIKVVMAAGELNTHAKQTAVGNKMNVLRPETLQKLVELKTHYQGSVNLFNLKLCLESVPFGEDADTKLNSYIDQIFKGIQIRSHIVEAVKQLIEIEPNRKQFEVSEIRVQYNASLSRIDGNTLDNQTTHEILIELSSPLTGYLGRVRGTSLQSDRFYFLRDMPPAALNGKP